MRITIKQIAEQSGLSIQTVSRILSDKGNLHQEATRNRVLEIARELGYRPHSSARAMRRGRFDHIALVQSGTDGVRSLLPGQLLAGIVEEAAARGLQVSITALSDAMLTDPAYIPKILREWTVDGLLINYNADIPAAFMELVRQYAIPAIWINSQQEADCIYPDDETAATEATQYLIQLGHSRIAYAGFLRSTHYSYRARQTGYEKAMQQAGLPVTLLQDCPNLLQERPAPPAWLSGPDRVTGVLTYTTQATQQMILLALTYGLRLPKDLSLLGFALRPEEVVSFPVDTMVLPEQEIGRKAVEMLLKKIEHPHEPLAPLPIPLQRATGWTTAAPPSSL